MKVTVEYNSGNIEEREGFKWFDDVGNRIAFHYANDEESGILEVPKRAIKEIRIIGFK